MRNTRIRQAADVVAVREGIPLEWVLHHVHQKAGKPCHRCGGTGIYTHYHGRCFACGGSGGRATPARVQEALSWVEENLEKVRKLGEKRDARRAKKLAQKEAERLERQRKIEAERDAAMEAWKRENPREWWALQNMPEGDFKNSLLQALNNAHKGWMTEARMLALWKEASKQEAKNRGDIKNAPPKGTKGTWEVTVLRSEWGDNNFGDHVFQVHFECRDGWNGRFETRSKKIIAAVEGQETIRMSLTGKIRWSKESYGIVGGHMKLTPSST